MPTLPAIAKTCSSFLSLPPLPHYCLVGCKPHNRLNPLNWWSKKTTLLHTFPFTATTATTVLPPCVCQRGQWLQPPLPFCHCGFLIASVKCYDGHNCCLLFSWSNAVATVSSSLALTNLSHPLLSLSHAPIIHHLFLFFQQPSLLPLVFYHSTGNTEHHKYTGTNTKMQNPTLLPNMQNQILMWDWLSFLFCADVVLLMDEEVMAEEQRERWGRGREDATVRESVTETNKGENSMGTMVILSLIEIIVWCYTNGECSVIANVRGWPK